MFSLSQIENLPLSYFTSDHIAERWSHGEDKYKKTKEDDDNGDDDNNNGDDDEYDDCGSADDGDDDDDNDDSDSGLAIVSVGRSRDVP